VTILRVPISPESVVRQEEQGNNYNGIVIVDAGPANGGVGVGVPLVSPTETFTPLRNNENRRGSYGDYDSDDDTESEYLGDDHYDNFDVYNGGDGMTASTVELTPLSLFSSPSTSRGSSVLSLHSDDNCGDELMLEGEQGEEELDDDDSNLPRFIDLRSNLFSNYSLLYDNDESSTMHENDDVDADDMMMVGGGSFFSWMSRLTALGEESGDDGWLNEFSRAASRLDGLPLPLLERGSSGSSSSSPSHSPDKYVHDASHCGGTLERLDGRNE
jgi:hypothetical protein